MFSVVKMMKEQGNQFDWSQIAIDIPSLPCFKPEDEWPKAIETQSVLDMLAEGYAVLDDTSDDGGPIESGWSGVIVKVTGDNPHLVFSEETHQMTTYVDCEPVTVIIPEELSGLTPVRDIIFEQGTGRVVSAIGCKEKLWAFTELGAHPGNGVYLEPVYEHPEVPALLRSLFEALG